MAFYASSAADTEDMLGQIVTFLQGNGYTLQHDKSLDNGGGNGVLTHEVCLLHSSGFYITLMTTNTNAEHPYWGTGNSTYYAQDTDVFGKNKFAWGERYRDILGATLDDVDPYLGACLHLGYDNLLAWSAQPQAKKVYSRTDGTGAAPNAYSAMAGSSTGISSFWVFVNENPHCVHIVAEYKLGCYSHMTFGNLQKSHTYVGGQYLVGSARPIIGNHQYDGYLGLGFEPDGINSTSFDWCKLFSYSMYCEGDGDSYYVAADPAANSGWGRCIHATGVCVPYAEYEGFYNDTYGHLPISEQNNYVDAYYKANPRIPLALGFGPAFVGTDETQRNLGGYLSLASTYDAETGQAAPIPLTGWCDHKAGGAVYLGSYVHVGLIMMTVYSGKEEVTIGGQTYVVFPMSSLIPDSFDNSPAYGVGGKSRKAKEANCYQLGLAIRKVV